MSQSEKSVAVESNKRHFTVKVGDKELRLFVKRPDQKLRQQAQAVYNRAFRFAVKPADGKAGAICKPALEGVLREQKLWDDAKQAEYERLSKALEDGAEKLRRGNIPLISGGREVAIQMRRDRAALNRLWGDRTSLDANTAESQAENEKFNYLVANCTYLENGTRFFRDQEDYDQRADDPVAEAAAGKYALMEYGLEDDYASKYPENEWLLAYKLARPGDLKLTDRQGNLVDTKMRRIDEEGFLLNADGQRIDEEGRLLDAEGQVKVEAAPFLDEDGSPVPIPAALVKPEAPAEKPEAKPAIEADAKVKAEPEKVAVAL